MVVTEMVHIFHKHAPIIVILKKGVDNYCSQINMHTYLKYERFSQK